MNVVIIGTGYVGLVTGAGLSMLGHHVSCYDPDGEKIKLLRNGKAPFFEPGLAELIQNNPKLTATSSLDEAMRDAQISFITVGTPFGPSGEIDLRFVATAAKQIGDHLRASSKQHIVVVKSTVIPGTSSGVVKKILRESAGYDVPVCMNPEFLREGSAVEDFMKPDRIVIGSDQVDSARVLLQLYETFQCPKVVTTLLNAEIIKYASNSFLATLISFANEIASVCEALPGADCDEVWEGLHLDRRLSPVINGQRIRPDVLGYLRHGPGFGGSCLPKDLSALQHFYAEHRVASPLLDAVIKVNRARPQKSAEILASAVGDLPGKRIAFFGLAFKANTDDVRESPALNLALILRDAGAEVVAFDPHVKAANGIEIFSSPMAAADKSDAVVIGTDWNGFTELDWSTICGVQRRRIVFDPRSLLKNQRLPADVCYIRMGKGPQQD